MALVALALLLSSPLSALAREDRVNGRDGAEGDPQDGNEFDGGGGSGDVSLPPGAARPIAFEFPVVVILNGSTVWLTWKTPSVQLTEASIERLGGRS